MKFMFGKFFKSAYLKICGQISMILESRGDAAFSKLSFIAASGDVRGFNETTQMAITTSLIF